MAMDSLKFHLGLPSPTFHALQASHPLNGLKAILGVARPQGGQPVAILYPFGHPTLNTYAHGATYPHNFIWPGAPRDSYF
jgi:hypothetical protein